MPMVKKKSLSEHHLRLYWEACMSKKPSVEEQKKKQAYYGKGEKKAKTVKK
jgi:hypothetical protein